MDKDIVKKAYKKLKSSVYYDKTQLELRDKIVSFEAKGNLDRALTNSIFNALVDEEKFNRLTQKILKNIDYIAMPKNLEEKDNNDANIISNAGSSDIKIKEIQFYLDMPVEGHILGTLWVMFLGYVIDEKIYEHSYGNRTRKTLVSETSGQFTFSPYLFQPYFEQYESWRDTALDVAERHIKNNQDVVIITMDFKRYYYSLDITQEVMTDLFAEIKHDIDPGYLEICKRLNMFVGEVIEKYSKCFDKSMFQGRKILPIGFLPSNTIGNWCLSDFDKAVVDGWNPVYYGRYVDDIIFVDKIERNSDIAKANEKIELTHTDIIKYFLSGCTKWHGMEHPSCQNGFSLLLNDTEDNDCYIVNPLYILGGKTNSHITVQNKKVRIFYFKREESDALIRCFRDEIAKNKSEFRHLPEDEAVFQKDDYADIYTFSNSGTVNKFRSIEEFKIDKFELSKYLGKYMRVAGMVRDEKEHRFEKDVLKIFNEETIISNYHIWEKVIEILVINERYEELFSFCKKVDDTIQTLEISDSCDTLMESKEMMLVDIRQALRCQLMSGLVRNFGLVWKKERKTIQKRIFLDVFKADSKDLEAYDLLILRYCKCRMIDKTVMPVLIDMIDLDSITDISNVNFTRFDEVIGIIQKEISISYNYHPYLISMSEFNINICLEEMLQKKKTLKDFPTLKDRIVRLYSECNYRIKKDGNDKIAVDKIGDNANYLISVGDGHKKCIRVAIANVRLNYTDFECIMRGKPNRSYRRYMDLSKLVNGAIDEHSDILAMPEAYVPFEWIPVLARTSARNRIAIVTGVEHVKIEEQVFNLTAIILPYKEDTHNSAYVSFHLKKYYAPKEIEDITGYGKIPVKGNSIELYKWNECYFPVYCCFELSSITDRAAFQSYADMLIAVEWNPDVRYYSNILESLSRDIHCYCVQVNSSDYGDSRITKPSKYEEKDLIRTKGGLNSSILIDDIDIYRLREFQLKEYSLQKKDGSLKLTPPNFNRDIVLRKIKGQKLI